VHKARQTFRVILDIRQHESETEKSSNFSFGANSLNMAETDLIFLSVFLVEKL
jgi:hypothetical protein